MAEPEQVDEQDAVICGELTWLRPAGEYVCTRSLGHGGDHFDVEKARAWPPNTLPGEQEQP